MPTREAPKPIADRLLELLPEDGTPIYVGELAQRAKSLSLDAANAYAQLMRLCSAQRAFSAMRDGHQFVRRRLPGEEPLVARPNNPPPRFIRVAPKGQAPNEGIVKKAAGWR